MQIFIHWKTTLHVSGVTAPIIMSIKNCTRSLRYRYYLYRRLRVQFLILLMMGVVTPETCRVVLQWINICILLHLLDSYSHCITMHGTTSLKKVYFFPPNRTDGVSCPPCFLFSAVPEGKRQGVKLTTHLQLVERLRISGSIPPLPRKS